MYDLAEESQRSFRTATSLANLDRSWKYAVALFALHVPLLVIDILRVLRQGASLNPGYRYLFYLHLVLMSGMLLYVALYSLLRPRDEVRPAHSALWGALVVFILTITAVMSGTDQLLHGQITVYVIACLAVAAGLYAPLGISLPIYLFCHAVFLYAVITFQDNPDVLVGHIVNGTLVMAVAATTQQVIYSGFKRNWESMRVIRQQRLEMERLAVQDSLTKLYNRRYAREQLSHELAMSRRYGRGVAVAMADIDHFKQVNDTYSHRIGDEVLVQISRILGRSLRTSDTVSRYGGEEFLLILPETDSKGAFTLCEKVREAIVQHDWTKLEPGLMVTVSFGVADDSACTEADDLVELADRKLYEAKRAGRNRVQR